MPSKRSRDSQRNPWQGRVQLEGKVYWLGAFPTRAAAEVAEDQFKQALHDITAEAQYMWRQRCEYLQAVARVTSGNAQ